jgi:sirohydrochlorin cobaltochelatase
MHIRTGFRDVGFPLLLFLSLAGPAAFAADEHAHHDHGSGAVVRMDAEGKRLESYNQRHEMTPEMREELRKKVALYRGFTDRELDMNMNAMGPDYEWYVSDVKVKGTTGILVLSHGVGENSDRLMRDAFLPMAKKTPVAIGFGMAMMSSSHLQSAVDDLRAAGVRRIVLVDQGTTTRYNSLTRHWQYIFGMYPESSYMDVPKIKAPGVEFVWAGHFNDDPLITEMLYDGAMSVSTNPANEVVIIVGHGPEEAVDNAPDLKIIQAHADRIKAKKKFADVRITNLQDDAIVPVRESNVRKLRAMIQQATKAGRKVIVVPIAAASYGVQRNIKTDLRGLQYTFAEKGLIENPKFMQWVDSVIRTAEARPAAQPASRPM